jgi:hypothetical protein
VLLADIAIFWHILQKFCKQNASKFLEKCKQEILPTLKVQAENTPHLLE